MTPPNLHDMSTLHNLQVGLSRRQMLRQQSYKIAQQQQILPPLPLTETENRDLLAFQAIVEDPNRVKPKDDEEKFSYQGSMDIIQKDRLGNENWSNLPSSLQSACQISEIRREGREEDAWTQWSAAPGLFQPQACFQVFQQIN